MTAKKESDLYMVSNAAGQVYYADGVNRYVVTDIETATNVATQYISTYKTPFFVFKAIRKVEPITPAAKITEL